MSNIDEIKSLAHNFLKKKVQVGYHEYEKKRELGERWTDADGIEWEQKNGYVMKNPDGVKVGFGDNCPDCGILITRGRHKDTYIRMGKCFHCQLNFEVDLKSMKIGNQGLNKWHFWVRLQEMSRWDSIIEEFEQWQLETKGKKYTNIVDNALANDNVKQTIEKNKRLTGA